MRLLNKKSYLGISLIVGLALFVGGFLFGAALVYQGKAVSAQDACQVNQEQLTKIYEAMFYRPLDDQALSYVDYGLDFVLDQLTDSQEHIMYSGVFKATKALENVRREPGEIAATEEDDYLDIIDSALSHVDEWAKTLPEQAEEDAVVGPEQAREAIEIAYDNMNAVAQAAAEYGLFQAQKNIGKPSDLPTPGQ